MLIRSLGALLIAASTSQALQNTSPFILLSTETINHDTLQSSQIATASSLEDKILNALSSCDASHYVFVEQGGIRTSDLRDSHALPQLQKRMSQDQYKSVVQIPEVVGNLDIQKVGSQLGMICEEKNKAPLPSHTIMFPVITNEQTAEGRKNMLQETDNRLAQELLTEFSNLTSHVLIFTSKSADAALAEQEYLPHPKVEMDEPPFQEDMHTDLKRDVERGTRRRRQAGGSGDDFQKGLGLFERYQFLSPGIFMGITVSLLLLAILYVGITAIAGLEVSYMAFSKEMGPQAQKKQQ